MEDQDIFINLDEYETQNRIGIGGFGEVFTLVEKSSGKIYAAKISLVNISEDQSDEKSLIIELRHEVNILAQLNHPAIVKFIGYSPTNFKKEPKPVIITEYVSNGSLRDIIQLEQKSKQPELWNDTKKLINIYGIASAMAYLHSHNIIHRDLKTGNILEDDYLFPKIADFGLSKFYHQNEESMSVQSTKELKGTPKYVAPESWESYEYTKEGDVYSFSFIVYQILTHEEPFKNFNMQMLYSQVVKNGLRPEFPQPIAQSYRDLISQCWSSKPEDRPTFSEIVNRLKTDPGFITEKVDKEKYLYYINLIDNYQTTYDPSKKFAKVVMSQYQNQNENKNLDFVTKEVPMKIDFGPLKEDVSSSSTLSSSSSSSSKNKKHSNSPLFEEITKMKEFKELFEETQEFLKQALNSPNVQGKTIKIPTNKTILLYANDSFTTPEFIQILKLFESILIEIKFPSNVFEPILNSISNLMKNELKTIKIHIIITKIEQIKKIIQNSTTPISIVIENSVTEIDECAFERCSSINEITLPSSVTQICSYAFSGCSKLQQITIPSSVTKICDYAFNGCSQLEEINVPSFVTEIGNGSFSFCSKLKQMKIPSSVDKLNESLFEECSSLSNVIFENPNSVLKIGMKAFKGCSKLSQFVIPQKVTKIESRTFERCSSLLYISIHSAVKEIDEAAFAECTSLEKIEFDDHSQLVSIGEKAFCGCSALTEVEIPSSVTEIGGKSFEGCKNMKKISIPLSIKKLFLSRFIGIDKNVVVIKK